MIMGKTDKVLSNNDEENTPPYCKALMADSKETRNEEKVEKRELERITTKYIVYGAE